MKVELFISARKLRDLDVFSKSDPQCRIYEMIGSEWVLRGQTERMMNNLNPDFQTSVVLNYFFEKQQQLRFEMVDSDGHHSFDLIG